ncbi:cytochrome c [Nitrosomonas europaea]|uniref:Probable cytochrome c n=1 Tax=Nitrosomonas europaea (strain ATCC 19718 / CIP 103999 / KCTC 2705 / NBRC 14298) TaxID=228410 RepID=Q82VZ6_NITEU|nr:MULTISPECIES: cytochrome c [Nitrosomonas]CAD84814.1 probable cytochrome c [Nitrosomonas europaea ATCC 19718]SDW17617.1 Cytochrome c, mono-and diheme variants [Nitrosomonas europaea]SES78992.1 Cytochrome c, mono-and diheme variants [Nitrosomonas europaea]SJZ33789.1 Cytochrome c, mono-and diheme variants [Nitrosomonas europaea]HBF25812.1 cytochrome c [Nitrosomonas sp.]
MKQPSKFRSAEKKQVAVFIASMLLSLSSIAATQPSANSDAEQVLRGEYLTRAGNCMGCHTTRGGKPYAGGRELVTPFGKFVTPNITPDNETGIGHWSEEDFWQALHYGKGRDGSYLYPVFPYTEYTKVTRQDADAIFAYLRSLTPVAQTNPPHKITSPYDNQFLLFLWRTWYFKEGVYEPDDSKSEEWNRGNYLVQGLGHCNACHTPRNVWGASQDDKLAGGEIMGTYWYAPSLISHREAGMGEWPVDEIAKLLSTGVTGHAVTSGPMATIVRQSLQYLSKDDMRAVAVYLQSLGEKRGEEAPRKIPPMPERVSRYLALGEPVYIKHCQECHGKSGEGVPGVYPPLAGNRSVTMTSPLNTIRSVLYGGFSPATAGNPRPYGMPPFQHIIRDHEIAWVVSYIRNAWGNFGSLVSPEDVDSSRGNEF